LIGRLRCSRRAWRRLKGLQMSVTTLENLLKVIEKLSQQDINRAMLLAFDEIIRELKRLDIETWKAKRAINRRFLNL